jgi:predicted nucleotidyltransferase
MTTISNDVQTITSKIPPEIFEMTSRLVEAFQPERIYLFGSTARGDASSDSDYDLMIVVANSNEPQYRRSQAAHRVLAGFNRAKDVLVWTREEFDKRTHLVASLPATILREGVLLYER